MRKKLQKIQLFSIDQQQRGFAWMNDRVPTSANRNSLMAEQVHREISRHVTERGEIPEQVRMNPWSIFELPSDRWEYFLFMIEGRIVSVPIVADSRVCVGRVHCVGVDETVIAMRAVRIC